MRTELAEGTGLHPSENESPQDVTRDDLPVFLLVVLFRFNKAIQMVSIQFTERSPLVILLPLASSQHKPVTYRCNTGTALSSGALSRLRCCRKPWTRCTHFQQLFFICPFLPLPRHWNLFQKTFFPLCQTFHV